MTVSQNLKTCEGTQDTSEGDICLLGEKKAGGSWTAKEIKMSESKAEANLLLFLQVKHTITGW